MMIDKIYPKMVAEHGTLKERLSLQAKEQGLSDEQVASRFGAVSSSLIEADELLEFVFFEGFFEDKRFFRGHFLLSLSFH